MIETLLKPGMVLIPLILTLKSRGRLFCECEASLFTQGVPDQLGIHNETLSQEEMKESERGGRKEESMKMIADMTTLEQWLRKNTILEPGTRHFSLGLQVF